MPEQKRIPLILGALFIGAIVLLFLIRAAMAPAPGSPAWCRAMMNKPQGQVTPAEAQTFAESCMR